MKNPIILKDLLIGVNNVIGKVTIISVLFLVAAFTVLTHSFDPTNGSQLAIHFSNNDFLMIGYLFGWGIIFILAIIKWIISICSEKSQMTYELIKISKISASKYILWKFMANFLYFWLLSVMLLPFGAMITFIGGVSSGDILLLLVHILLFAAVWSALWWMIWCLGRNITLSFLIVVWWAIIWGICLDAFYFLENSFAYMIHFGLKNWMYSVLMWTISTLGFLIYSIQSVKQETENNTNRYPIVLSLLLFCVAIVQVVFLEYNAYYVFAITSIIDLMLLIINMKKFDTKHKKIFQYHVLTNFLIVSLATSCLEFFSLDLLTFILLVQILIVLISLVVIELYKKINLYLHKFIYIIIVLFVLFVLPNFVNNMKQVEMFKSVTIHIPTIEMTYENMVEYNKNQYLWKKYWYDSQVLDLFEIDERKYYTYYYLYIWIVLMLIFTVGLYYEKRK